MTAFGVLPFVTVSVGADLLIALVLAALVAGTVAGICYGIDDRPLPPAAAQLLDRLRGLAGRLAGLRLPRLRRRGRHRAPRDWTGQFAAILAGITDAADALRADPVWGFR